jgi:hypothetical protein
MSGPKEIAIWMIRAFITPDLEVAGYGPNGGMVIDLRLAEALRELESAGVAMCSEENGDCGSCGCFNSASYGEHPSWTTKQNPGCKPYQECDACGSTRGA